MTTVEAEIDPRDNWYFYGMRSQFVWLKVSQKSKTTSKLLIRVEAARLTSHHRQHTAGSRVSAYVSPGGLVSVFIMFHFKVLPWKTFAPLLFH